MGFNTGGGQKTYLNISDGKISVKVPEGSENAIKCTNKDQTKTWYEKRYPSFTGKIVGISKRIPENPIYSPQLCIEIDDNGEKYELQMGWSSGYSSGFFLAMPNINFKDEVTFTPWMKVVDDKKKTSLFITNKGEEKSAKWYWTKDEPKDCPPMVQIKVKGNMVWDDSARQEFFEKYIEQKIKPQLTSVSHVIEVPEHEIEPEQENDLPF